MGRAFLAVGILALVFGSYCWFMEISLKNRRVEYLDKYRSISRSEVYQSGLVQLEKRITNENKTGWIAILFGVAFVGISLALRSSTNVASNTARFNCPECGESISMAAKSCRFCNCIISLKDKQRARVKR